jgi:hypothetical protein
MDAFSIVVDVCDVSASHPGAIVENKAGNRIGCPHENELTEWLFARG